MQYVACLCRVWRVQCVACLCLGHDTRCYKQVSSVFIAILPLPFWVLFQLVAFCFMCQGWWGQLQWIPTVPVLMLSSPLRLRMEMWEKMANSISGWESFISLIWLYVIITSCILISPSWLHVSCLVFPFSDMSVVVVVSCFFDLYLFYNGMYFHVFFTYKFFWKIIFPMFLLVF